MSAPPVAVDWAAVMRSALPHLEAGPLAGKRRRETFEHGGRTVRYGTKGGLRVTLDGPHGGTWTAHDGDGQQHGVVDLVRHLYAVDRPAAVRMLRDWGALPASGPQACPGRPVAGAPAPGVSQPRPGPERGAPASLDGAADRLAHARRLMAVSEPIPRDPKHPARRWLAARHLWRTDVDLPPWLRWLPAAAIHPDHLGAGAILVPVAPLAAWAAAAPEWPRQAWTGVQLVHMDRDGAPALDRPEATGGLGKRSHGALAGGVVAIGDLRQAAGVVVAEGLADALALAARRRDVALATLGTAAVGRPALARDLAALGCPVTLAPDADAAGRAAAATLQQALAAHGIVARALADWGGAADAAAVDRPFAAVDRRVMAALYLMHRTGAGVHPVRPDWESRRLAAVDAAALAA